MQNTMRKLLSAILVLVLFVGLMAPAATAMAAEAELTEVSSWNLVLADEIAVNFYVSISNAAAEDAVMVVTDGYGTHEYPIATAKKNEEGKYLFTAHLAAAQMADNITLQLISGDQTGAVHTYSAVQYARHILTGEDYSQATKDLILAMVNYGAAAQNYFGYNTGNLANAGYEATALPQIPAAGSIAPSGSVSGITFYGASLLFESRVAVRFYFAAQQVEGYTFTTADGKTHTPEQKNGLYYVEIPGINPQNYDKAVSLTVSDGTDSLSVSYSPMTYIARKYVSGSETLKALVAAMCRYNQAAEAYLIACNSSNASGDVTSDENGIVTEQVIISGSQSSATVAAGTQLEENTTTLTLSVAPLEDTDSDVVLSANEELLSVDVHVSGVAAGNTVPVIVTLNELAPEFLNKGNITLYHVENGVTVEMTRVYSAAEVDAHNEYYYDIVTGTVTMAVATFSEFVAVSNSENAWNGDYDYSWYTDVRATKNDTGSQTYLIYNADQLAGFGAIVGGMDGQTQDSFSGKTVKLMADIDLGDDEENNDPNKIFYPIGYYNSEGTYEKSGTAITSGFYPFEGTFDGNGNTISNFYQNTWEMKGDNEYYAATEQRYRDGMGLFGKVYGGTVQNLTVKNFSSDGEYTTTGVIAAYADSYDKNPATFKNIAIVDCNPRVYNIGNGGIVGCAGWYSRNETVTEAPITFENITVDNSNKISALWGSWDVACGGILGQYYPNSGCGVSFTNCHVAAVIDVYNDVCANYQYYAYRYAGMMIGSVRENVTGENGRVYPKTDGITASGCTVHYDTWNDYYYCELVANSLASYTHDHQFSRLTQVEEVDTENMKYLPLGATEYVAIPTSGRVNYVVVATNDDGTFNHGTDNAECFHFVDGILHDHNDYNGDGTEDKQTVNSAEIYVEDHRHIYLPFSQLFTGYSWGVTSAGIGDYAGIKVEHVDQKSSVEKFVAVDDVATGYVSGAVITVGDLFAAKANVTIDTDNVQVFVSPADETSTVSGTYVANTADWTKGVLVLTGSGDATITITDYNYCKETTLSVTVKAPSSEAVSGSYVKVTEDPADWTGTYLIVYEDGSVAFNGGLTDLDKANNTIGVTISGDTISATDETKAAQFTITATDGGYTIQSASGYYIGSTEKGNNLDSSTSAGYVNEIGFEDDDVKITASSGTVLRYNANSNSYWFRYFKADTYTSQKPIALYKYVEETGTDCDHTGAAVTVEPADCTHRLGNHRL